MSIENYKAALLHTLTLVETDLTSIAKKDETTGDWVVTPDTDMIEADENSEADAYEGTEERQATLGELEVTYRNVVRALEKIDSGTFGTCEICNELIESDRLEVLPAARTCKAHRDEEQSLTL
jgi:RNA polymerase-binding transcription factor DksA